MINWLRRSVIPQSTRGIQSLFSALLGEYSILQWEKPAYRNAIFGFGLILILGILVNPAYSAGAAAPTHTQTETVEVVVLLLDASSQPLASVSVNIALIRYSQTVEEVQCGSCITDEAGSCTITVTDPPRLRSGRIEGFIDLGNYGRQLIGWEGPRVEITLQLDLNGRLATAPVPLDQPYAGQTEQPTDAPLSASTSTPAAVGSPIATATVFLNTAAPVIPITRGTGPATATLTAQPPAPNTPTPAPLSRSSRIVRMSAWSWIGLGLALLAGLSAAWASYFHCQRKRR